MLLRRQDRFSQSVMSIDTRPYSKRLLFVWSWFMQALRFGIRRALADSTVLWFVLAVKSFRVHQRHRSTLSVHPPRPHQSEVDVPHRRVSHAQCARRVQGMLVSVHSCAQENGILHIRSVAIPVSPRATMQVAWRYWQAVVFSHL